MKNWMLGFCFLAFMSIAIAPLSGQGFELSKKSIRQMRIDRAKIAPGLKLQIYKGALWSSPQSFQVLEIGKKRRLDIVFKDTMLVKTSEFGKENNALAAVNAGFFDMRNGGSVTFLMVDDVVVDTNQSESRLITQSAIAITDNGRVWIGKAPEIQSSTVAKEYEDVLFTGPLLLLGGQMMPVDSVGFNTDRHPRSCACISKSGKVRLITVDGRHQEASGMSIKELGALMRGFNCREAINLDGGGSTTMWVKKRGVVNHPSDNRVFDHKGQRKVANAIVIH